MSKRWNFPKRKKVTLTPEEITALKAQADEYKYPGHRDSTEIDTVFVPDKTPPKSINSTEMLASQDLNDRLCDDLWNNREEYEERMLDRADEQDREFDISADKKWREG